MNTPEYHMAAIERLEKKRDQFDEEHPRYAELTVEIQRHLSLMARLEE